jgi:hypothetical protein
MPDEIMDIEVHFSPEAIEVVRGGRVLYSEPNAGRFTEYSPEGLEFGNALLARVLQKEGIGPDDFEVIDQKIRIGKSDA